MMRDIVFSPEKIGNADSELKEISRAAGRSDFRIVKKFIDARHKNDIKIVYRIDDEPLNEDTEALALPYKGRKFDKTKRPVIVGFGPAGMFAGLILASYGLEPVIIEKGRDVSRRTEDVEGYKNGLPLDPSSNIQFGEGGAGTFSDGKLYTGVSSGLKAYIGNIMTAFGAPADILYDSHPHVGTDNLINVVRGIREKIESLGGTVCFEEEMTGFTTGDDGSVSSVITSKREIETDKVILAPGNSSRDLFSYLSSRKGFAIESKPFSIGVRIEHKRKDIDIAMYGFDTALYRNICAANYKLSVDTSNRKLYTFCMCPGGEVVPSASIPGTIVTNGMSYRARDNENSNSALLVPFDPKEISDDPLAGMRYQTELETKAYELGGSNGLAPYCIFDDLKNGRSGSSYSRIKPTYRPGVCAADLRDLLPSVFTDTIREGIDIMGRKIKGFNCPDAVLTFVETRSSSPVRIVRDRETYESVSVKGLYPSGEGAGYAGGIMSSAIDGIKCAHSVAQSMLL